jgi:hypothetical protein
LNPMEKHAHYTAIRHSGQRVFCEKVGVNTKGGKIYIYLKIRQYNAMTDRCAGAFSAHPCQARCWTKPLRGGKKSHNRV